MTTDPLPADLAKPRRVRTGLIPGLIIGGLLFALNIGLLVYALNLY